MLRLTLAQMRRSLGRLVAAGIAIAIGTAFVTATLLAGDVFSRATDDALTARYGDADLVVAGPVTPEALKAVQDAPGVDAASPLLVGSAQIGVGTNGEYLTLLAQSPVPAFDTLTVVDGSLAAAGQIALPESTAGRLHVGVGDDVDVTVFDATDGQPTVEKVTVSGLVTDPAGAWTEFGGVGSATSADMLRWNGGSIDSGTILVQTDDVASTQAALLAQAPDGTHVWTKQQAASHAVSELSDDGTDFVLMLVLGFGAVALVVAGLVISNTFQVLVAQRTRTLALLRCVGARRSQLRASVLIEATIVGFGASAIGVLSGAALGQITLWALDGANVGGPRLPTTIGLSAVTILVPLVVGTAVTLLSCLVPARAATRVSPVAALRPAETPSVRSTAGTVRLTLSLVMAIGGLVGLALSVAAAHVSPFLGLGLGVLSGTVSFVGVLLGAVYWVPRVVGAFGRLLSRTGATARLAAANSVRNPRRTAATSTALLIGVTLVALMSTGAASARSSLASALDDQYPVDMVLSSYTADSDQGFVDSLAAVRGVPGVADVVELRSATVESADGTMTWEVLGVDPAQAREVVRNDAIADQLVDGVLLTSTDSIGFDAARANGLDLAVKHVAGLAGSSLVTADVLSSIDPHAPTTVAWARFTPGADASDVLDRAREVVGSDVSAESAGAERAQYERMIDTLLAIVVGLLGVAVLIALIGVANTLSLSVLERRRESATLRAIGLSRRRLRLSLGIEGMLIAGVGALLGVALGLVYGWAGSAIVFGSFGELHLAVPWLDLALVLAVAVAAGLVASVLPARRAARTSPVAALAVD